MVPGAVSPLDRVTLQLGVAVAVAIALCSYAVSATSLYALGVRAGYSWWQAAAVPVVADGPAVYGMFRIVSRSRRLVTLAMAVDAAVPHPAMQVDDLAPVQPLHRSGEDGEVAA